MTSTTAQAQRLSCIPPQRHHPNTEGCQHYSHGHVRHFCRIFRSAFELETAIVSRQETSQANEHFSERRVNVEVELPFQIMRAKFSEVSLIPNHEGRLSNVMKA